MKITDIRTHVLLDPAYDIDATSSAQDTIVVEIETDEGLVGIGETDLNAWIARACIEAPGTHTMDRGLRSLLLGRDPLGDPEAIWNELYVGTCMTGRRGALVNALGALDIALWDLRGKAAGVPVWKLLGEQARDELTPYASLQPETSSFDDYLRSMVAWAVHARELGFGAVKMEATFDGPYVHKGLVGPDERVIEVLRAVRGALGPEIAIMVDLQYAFAEVERALAMAEAIEPYDVFFLETPLWVDDLEGHAQLSERSPVRIASGEWLSSRFEHFDLIDRGGVHVCQPDIGRVGGLTEARRICAYAGERGRLAVPHAWKTGISVAVAAHLAMITPHMPYFEFLPAELCESDLRKRLTRDELVYSAGRLSLPERPGLGVELEGDALEEFAEAAKRLEHNRRLT